MPLVSFWIVSAPNALKHSQDRIFKRQNCGNPQRIPVGYLCFGLFPENV